MTLSYSTHWPKSMGPEYAGKPNHFVTKIWGSIASKMCKGKRQVSNFPKEYLECCKKGLIDWYAQKPKKHTLRSDPKDRWKVGMKIHPVINNRTKDRFQFAPVMEAKGIQKIDIVNYGEESDVPMSYCLEKFDNGRAYDHCFAIWIDDDKLLSMNETEILAQNDGFPSVQAFFAWFNKDFSGKIIHWTDYAY